MMAQLDRSHTDDQYLERLRTFELPATRWLLIGLVGAVIAAWIGWSAFETNHYRAAIPPEIGLAFGLATTDSDSSLWTARLPIPPKACGGAIFGLDSATAAAIRAQGPAFFKAATRGRGYRGPPGDGGYKWQPTPLPDGWISWRLQGMWYGLSCMRLRPDYAQSISAAAAGPNAFYTTGPSTMLLVIPDQRLVVVTYTH